MATHPVTGQRGAIIAAVLLLGTVSTGSTGAQVDHHTYFELPAPTWDSSIAVDDYALHHFTFHPQTTELVGHHEWRDVAPMTVNTTYGGHEHGDESFSRSESLDLETGLAIGSSFGGTNQHPLVGLLDLPQVAAEETSSGLFFGGSIGPHPDLPEALLWNREIWGYEAWDVQVVDPWAVGSGGETSAHVQVISDFWTGDTTVNVTVETQVDYEGGSLRFIEAWQLGFPAGMPASPVAGSRIHNFGYAYDDDPIQWYAPESRPATYTHVPGPPLSFDGRSDQTIVGPRDQRFAYGAPGLAPFDPQPHALFDVGEAATAALALDDSAVETFLAKAHEPYVAAARMDLSSTVPFSVQWQLRFEEAGHNALDVTFDGLKVPGQPLLVIDGEGSDAYVEYPVAATTRADIELAAVGDWARVADDVAEDLGLGVDTYAWDLWGYGDFVVSNLMFTAEDPLQLPFESKSLRASVHAANGIINHSLSRSSDLRLLPDGIPLPA